MQGARCRCKVQGDPVKRKASNQRYQQSDKGKAAKQRYDQTDQGKARKQAYSQSDQGKAAKQAYSQTDQGKAAKQAAKQRAASAAVASAAASASASLAFVTELKKLTHAQRVSDYFSEEELAAAADQVPYCPFYYSGGNEFRSCSPAEPRFLADSRRGRGGEEAFHQISRQCTGGPAGDAGWVQAYVDGCWTFQQVFVIPGDKGKAIALVVGLGTKVMWRAT